MSRKMINSERCFLRLILRSLWQEQITQCFYLCYICPCILYTKYDEINQLVVSDEYTRHDEMAIFSDMSNPVGIITKLIYFVIL